MQTAPSPNSGEASPVSTVHDAPVVPTSAESSVEWAWFSQAGLHHTAKRGRGNEDRVNYATDGHVHVFVVLDGHGGPAVAQRLSGEEDHACLADTLLQNVSLSAPLRRLSALWADAEQTEFGDPLLVQPPQEVATDTMDGDVNVWNEQQCIQALQRSMAKTFALEEEATLKWQLDSGDKSGACACVVLWAGRALVTANVGDCRCVMATTRDQEQPHVSVALAHRAKRDKAREGAVLRPIQLTADHTATTERERIEASGGTCITSATSNITRVFGRLEPSRSFGDPHLKVESADASSKMVPGVVVAWPDVHVRRCCPGEDAFLIMGSDGLWAGFTAMEAVNWLERRLADPSGDLSSVAKLMVERAAPTDCLDDTTAVIIRLCSVETLSEVVGPGKKACVLM